MPRKALGCRMDLWLGMALGFAAMVPERLPAGRAPLNQTSSLHHPKWRTARPMRKRLAATRKSLAGPREGLAGLFSTLPEGARAGGLGVFCFALPLPACVVN